MPQTNTDKSKSKNIPNIKRIAKIGIFTAFLALLSQIAIPLPGGVPVTLQTFAVCLCGYFLGKKDGLCSLCVYVMLGICGAPVFTGFSGGFYHFLGGTGGFIIGFIILAFLCGLGITENENPVAAIACGIAGIAVCHLLGVLWFAYVSKSGLMAAFLAASAGFIIKDIFSCVAAYAIYRAIPAQIRKK